MPSLFTDEDRAKAQKFLNWEYRNQDGLVLHAMNPSGLRNPIARNDGEVAPGIWRASRPEGVGFWSRLRAALVVLMGGGYVVRWY